MDKIRTGLAAFGMSGQVFHAPFISTNPHFELTAVVERSKELSRAKYPQSRIVRSFDELISMDELDLVVVNTGQFPLRICPPCPRSRQTRDCRKTFHHNRRRRE